MFSRKSGHYPQEPANFSLLANELPLQQPPMCTGKCLNFPDTLPPFKATSKKFSDIESQYSIRNLKKKADESPADTGFTTTLHDVKDSDSLANTAAALTEYRTQKSALTDKSKKKKFDFSAFKGLPNGPPSRDNEPLTQTSRSRQSSSVDVGHRADLGLTLKKKLSVQTTKQILAGPKHEFFFQHSNFI